MTNISTVREFIKAYVNGSLGRQTKCGNWSVINWGNMDVLQYFSDSEMRSWRNHKQEIPERIAYRLPGGSVISNANQLEYAVTYSYGHKRNRFGRQTECQEWLEEFGATPLPFTLFDEVEGADVRDFSWILPPKKENVKVVNIEHHAVGNKIVERRRETFRHFVGACLFMIGNDTFLFDVDRQELNHGIFNPFLTKLPKRVNTIDEAYEILMPDEIKMAMLDGVDVKRQGEFYFVKYSDECPVQPNLTNEEKQILRYPPSRIGYGITPVSNRLTWRSEDSAPFKDVDSEDPDEDDVLDTPEKREFQIAALKYKQVYDKLVNGSPSEGTLGKSATGSHSVEKYVVLNKIAFVSGNVKQNRRQHADLKLDGWYKVVPNTGVLSWVITGEID